MPTETQNQTDPGADGDSQPETLFQKHERLMIDLAHAMAAKDETEQHRLLDIMEEDTCLLTGSEILAINDISGDLYMLEDSEIFEPLDISESDFKSQFSDAVRLNDQNLILKLLRKEQSVFGKRQIALYRASAYAAIGHTRTSKVFERIADGR